MTKKLSSRATAAIEALKNGGYIAHGLETNSYTGRTQFTYRLRINGSTLKGFGFATFKEIESMLTLDGKGTSIATYYKLAA